MGADDHEPAVIPVKVPPTTAPRATPDLGDRLGRPPPQVCAREFSMSPPRIKRPAGFTAGSPPNLPLPTGPRIPGSRHHLRVKECEPLQQNQGPMGLQQHWPDNKTQVDTGLPLSYSSGMKRFTLHIVGLARAFVSAVFAVAGIGKVLDPTIAAQSWGTVLGVSEHCMSVAFRMVGLAELIVAGALLMRENTIPALAACLLSMTFFLISVIRNVGVLEVSQCGCFGLLSLGPSGPPEVVRDGLLVACSALVLVDSLEHSSTTDARTIQGNTNAGWTPKVIAIYAGPT